MASLVPHATFDARRCLTALGNFEATSKKEGHVVMRDFGRNLVKRIIGRTRPAQGSADSSARKHGERAIARDLDIIFEPLDPDEWRGFFADNGGLKIVPVAHAINRRGATVTDFLHFLKRSEMKGFHQKLRSRADGRVTQVRRETVIGRKKSDLANVGFVTKRDFKSYQKEAIGKVGILAAGWNRAAEMLGYRPPAWISRHGTSRGQSYLLVTATGVRLGIINAVPYVSAVKHIQSDVQLALNDQAGALERRLQEFALKKAAREAGLT
ncbi:MAG TPA: hypothetical protein VGO11_19590 [Chthoniobacteraceae bacterium]|jgi:hypothetical protein|nr:hypothetical protein [Chthoniobacteraceae bacterium]